MTLTFPATADERTDWRTARYADGIPLAAFIVPRLPDGLDKEHPIHGQIRRWREGGQASFVAADDALYTIGLHPSEAPEGIWQADRREHHRGGMTAEQRLEVQASTENTNVLAQRYGVSASTIRGLRRKGPKKVTPPEKVAEVVRVYREIHCKNRVATVTGVNRSTVRRILKRELGIQDSVR